MTWFILMTMSTMIGLSTSSMNLLWMAIEISTMAFAALTATENKKTALTYLITQSMPSIMLIMIMLMLYMSNPLNNQMENKYSMLMLSLVAMFKMGLQPFTSWFSSIIMEINNKKSIFFLMTIQKIIPMKMFMNLKMSNTWMFLILMNIILSIAMMMKNNKMITILIASSINHMCWMIILSQISPMMCMTYFLIYSMINMMILNSGFTMMKNNMMSQNNQFTWAMSLMSGIPPSPTFFLKMMTLQMIFNSKMSNMTMYFMMIMAFLFSLLYTVTMFSSLLSFQYSMKKNKMSKMTIMLLNMATLLPLMYLI